MDLNVLSAVQLDWITQLRRQIHQTPFFILKKEQILNGSLPSNKYQILDLIFYKGGILLDHSQTPLMNSILFEFHSSPLGGDAGVKKTLKHIKKKNSGSILKKSVEDYAKQCDTCQKSKSDNVA